MYGARMPFHIARSSGEMPLLVAIRYTVSPRCTTVLAPYLGTETGGGASRTTVLEHATSAAATAAARHAVRIGLENLLMRLVVPSPVCRASKAAGSNLFCRGRSRCINR